MVFYTNSGSGSFTSKQSRKTELQTEKQSIENSLRKDELEMVWYGKLHHLLPLLCCYTQCRVDPGDLCCFVVPQYQDSDSLISCSDASFAFFLWSFLLARSLLDSCFRMVLSSVVLRNTSQKPLGKRLSPCSMTWCQDVVDEIYWLCFATRSPSCSMWKWCCWDAHKTKQYLQPEVVTRTSLSEAVQKPMVWDGPCPNKFTFKQARQKGEGKQRREKVLCPRLHSKSVVWQGLVDN